MSGRKRKRRPRWEAELDSGLDGRAWTIPERPPLPPPVTRRIDLTANEPLDVRPEELEPSPPRTPEEPTPPYTPSIPPEEGWEPEAEAEEESIGTRRGCVGCGKRPYDYLNSGMSMMDVLRAANLRLCPTCRWIPEYERQHWRIRQVPEYRTIGGAMPQFGRRMYSLAELATRAAARLPWKGQEITGFYRPRFGELEFYQRPPDVRQLPPLEDYDRDNPTTPARGPHPRTVRFIKELEEEEEEQEEKKRFEERTKRSKQ